jgi:putative transposase
MPRSLRNQEPGLIRHVMGRGNGRMTIFVDDLDYRQFIQLFSQMVEDFDVECWNYCAMSNHYHATLVPRLRNISAAMQWLNGSYARWWNRRHVKVGHAFQGRFKAQIVQRDSYALTLSRYVALNPVRAALVKRPEEWRWSSYASIIGLRPAPSFLAIDATLGLFGEADRPVLQKRFAEFVLASCEDERDDRIRSNQRVLGDVAFKISIGARGASSPKPQERLVL